MWRKQQYFGESHDPDCHCTKQEWQQLSNEWAETCDTQLPPPLEPPPAAIAAGGDPNAFSRQTMPLDPNAREFVQNQQAAINNPWLPITAPHLPWMPSLQTPIATTHQEILLTTLNASSIPTDWSSLTAMDACATAGISADSIPSHLKALFVKTPTIMNFCNEGWRGATFCGFI